MTHKTGPEQAVGVNEGKAATVGVSLLSEYDGTPDKQLIGSVQPFERTLGRAGAVVGPGPGPAPARPAGAQLPARQSRASPRQAATPGALLLNFTIHMLNLQFSALAKL